MLKIFIVMYLMVLFISFKKLKKGLIINPLFWLYMAWGLIIGLYYTSGIEYNQKPTFNSLMYIILSLIIFTISYYLGKNTKIRHFHKNIVMSSSRNSNQFIESKINIRFYFILALIGIFLWLLDVIRLNNIILGFRIENFNISIVGAIGSILLNISLVVWLYQLIYTIRNNKKLGVMSLVSAVIYISFALVTAGRQAILIFFISSFIVLIYSLNLNNLYRYKNKIFISLSIAISIIFIYLINISISRSEVSNKVALFEYILNSSTSAQTLEFVNKFGIISDVILDIIYYYSQEVPMFDLFFNEYSGQKFWGIFQLHYVGRRLPYFMINYDRLSAHINLIAYNANVVPVYWTTALSAFIIDFGRVGALFFISLLGVICGKVHKNFIRNNSTYNLMLLTMVCVGAAFSIQYSPFSEISWAYPLYWLLLTKNVPKIKLKLGR